MFSRVKQQFFAVIATLLLLCTCAGDGQVPPINTDLPPEDLEVFDTGKADGNIFNKDRIIEDHVFVDPHFLSLADVKAFLEWTPYIRPSFLASYEEDGLTAAEIIIETALTYKINPLVILVKLQVESSLIGRTEPPSQFILERCMGCGCQDDNPSCFGAPKGFRNQVICAAYYFRNYMDDLNYNGATWTGWAVGKNKLAADDILVSPETKATAALYTYTPWILQGQGGNWLFWNVYRKYTHHILKTRPNHRWIGGLCENDDGCAFDEGLCKLEFAQADDVHSSSATGFCSRKCDRFCPDTYSAYNAYTFCVDLGSKVPDGEPEGWCVSKCDDALFPGDDECIAGFECVVQERFNDPEFSAKVCMPILPDELTSTEEEVPPSDESNPHD